MWLASTLVWLSLLVALPAPAFARCDPATLPDKPNFEKAREAVAANCDCAGAASHGDYVRCARQQAEAVLLNRGCVGRIKKCASKSICGKPGWITCCVRTKNGESKCKRTRSAASCEAKGGTAGACTSCCDACPDPGTGPSCSTSTSTTTTTTTTPTTGAEQCCLQETACGDYHICRLMPRDECGAAHGISIGVGTCSGSGGSPCNVVTTTTTPPSACCIGTACTEQMACQCGVAGGQYLLLRDCTSEACCMGDQCTMAPPCECLANGGQLGPAGGCTPGACGSP